MKLPILAGGLLALAACATESGEQISLPNFGDHATRCQYARAGIQGARDAKMAYIKVPENWPLVGGEVVTVAMFEGLVEKRCADVPAVSA